MRRWVPLVRRFCLTKSARLSSSAKLQDTCLENSASNEQLRKPSVGLYGYDVLRTARGFRDFAHSAIERSEALIDNLKLMPPSMETIKCMDEISNTICMVVDAAELCRNTHPNKEFVEEANHASMKVYQYLHSLNTNRILYDVIVNVENANVLTTDEARRAARTLRQDFERGGIHLSPEKMERVNELNLQITQIGRLFNQNVMHSSGSILCPASKIPESLHGTLQASLVSSGRNSAKDVLHIPTDPGIVSSVLKWVPDNEVRKQMYIAGYSTPKENLAVLDNLIATRHELAEILGYGSYAEFSAATAMAGSPEVIKSFLDDLLRETRSKSIEETAKLEAFSLASIDPWDEAFYMGRYKANEEELDAKVVSSYFPLGQCMEGLKVLVRSLFDATFEQVPAAPGEVWHRDVEKWELRHNSEGVLGYMFLDLYSRKGKYPNCAHFTIRGGRKASETEYQLPVLALVCNFSKSGSSPPLLQHWEVENLFHEFGHALHSLLSRTDYQHFSGTRTVIDFAETPSNLLECYAWDYRVLKTFARDHVTGDVIPEKMVASLVRAKKMFGVTDLLRQVLYAYVDQEYFGPQPVSTTQILADMQKHCKMWKHVDGTHWQTRFQHLITYGAGYYSYLYARCIAATIWQKMCVKDPLSLEAGDVLRRGILQYGGSKDPALILRECLGQDALVTTPSGGVKPCVKQHLSDLGVYQ